MPIPDNTVKELLSRSFLGLAVNRAGFIVSRDEVDFGTDVTLKAVDWIHENGRSRYRGRGVSIEVQLKATSERHIEIADGTLKYDLEVKNYNDLVARRGSVVPLVLALYILPDDPTLWLSLAETELTLRKCGYIWRPGPEDAPSRNEYSKTIAIPLSSRIDDGTFHELFEELTS
jgi:hypothetical protein